MLAIARILRTGARLLLLDEPTEGLAPVIVQQIGATIRRLKAEGFTVLLVEQNFRFAATVADRHYVVERGRVVDMIDNAALDRPHGRSHDYLGCTRSRGKSASTSDSAIRTRSLAIITISLRPAGADP